MADHHHHPAHCGHTPWCHGRAMGHRHHVCQHQIEVMVAPATAEVYFRDERHVDPLDTQVRFSALVYNAPSARVHWKVTDLAGNPGAGSIDQSGLYRAPNKGSIAHGTTDLVVVTALDDPLRSAVARVALLGDGPEIAAEPRIEIVPKVAHVYYAYNQEGYDHNEFLEKSSKVRHFFARIKHSASHRVEWRFDGVVPADATDHPWYTYMAPHSGANTLIRTRVTLLDHPGVTDWGDLFLVNYRWPGIRA